jgi:hypothetical protein
MPFTLETVKAYGGTGNDIVIQAKIDAFASIYACLTSSYDDAIADDIANSYIAGMLQSVSGEGQVTSRKAPNGASRNFKQNKYGDSGEYDNALIEAAYKADTNFCLPIDDSYFLVGTAGAIYPADNPQ